MSLLAFGVPPSLRHTEKLMPHSVKSSCKPPRVPGRRLQESDMLLTTSTASAGGPAGDFSRLSTSIPASPMRQQRPSIQQSSGAHYRYPSQDNRTPGHQRRPSYGGSDYGDGSGMRTPSLDVYGRPMQRYTPMQMTPKGIAPPSPWAGQVQGIGDVVMESLDCGAFIGRAGCILFFFLTFGIRHRLKAIPATEDLDKRKEILRVRRGGVVTPQWPICYHDNFALVEVSATVRFFATKIGQYGTGLTPQRDYQADHLLEKLAYWRDTLSQLIGEMPDRLLVVTIDSPSVAEYLSGQRASYLSLFEGLLRAADSAYFLGDEVSWVDPVIFAVLFDDLGFVLSVFMDKVEKRARALLERGASEEDQARCYEAARAEIDKEKEAQDCLFEQHGRLKLFMQRMIETQPVLGRWVSEHRKVWFGWKPEGERYDAQGSELQRHWDN